MPDKWAQYAVPADKWAQFAAPSSDTPAQPAGVPAGVTLGQPAAHPAVNMQPSLLGRDAAPKGVVSNLLTGAVKSGIGTVSGADDFAQKHLPTFMTTPIGQAPTADNSARAIAAAKQMATPNGTAQSIGKGIGNAAQFLIPGAAEEAGASMLAPTIGKVASKLATSAIGSGVVNKAQGGGFGAGAAAGAVGSGAGQVLKSWAPKVAESALGVLAPQRMNGRTIGQAILNDTTGIKPLSVAKSAEDSIGRYTDQLHTAAGASKTPFSMVPARLTLQDAIDNSAMQNSPTALKDLNAAKNQLRYQVDPTTSVFDKTKLIPNDVTPIQGLQYKRGLNDLVNNWATKGGSPAEGPIKQTYGALDAELDRTVPGAQDLNQKISSLIPVSSRATLKANMAPTTQQLFHKLAAPTGALVAPLAGGTYGYEHGGAAGAVGGAAAGLMLPALLATPAGQMALARAINSKALPKLVAPVMQGAGLQLGRSLSGNAKPQN